MKHILVAALLFSGNVIYAQAKKGIELKQGEKILAVSTINANVDMGMGMQIKNNTSTTNLLLVTGESDKDYILSNTVSRLQTVIEMMGKKEQYDSDKEADRNSEMGKAMGDVVGKTVTLNVNKFNGKTMASINDSITEKDGQPLNDLVSVFGGGLEEASALGAFMLLPKDKKAGDKWNITDSTKDMKSTKTYTYSSIKDNIATINYLSKTEGEKVMAVQGNDMNVAMTTNIKGEVLVDTKTNRVLSRTMDTESSGTIDVAGQSMPLTATTRAEATFTPVKN